MTGRSRHDELRHLAEVANDGLNAWWSVDEFAEGFPAPPEVDGYLAMAAPAVLLALLDELAAAEARAADVREIGELLAIVASEASANPYVGSEAQKEAWDGIKRRFAAERARADKAERELAEYTTDIGYKAGYEAAKQVYAALAEKAERERDERMTREGGLALIEDTRSWQRNYEKARDDFESERARADKATQALAGVANAYGCFAGCTGALPGAPTDGSGHTPACRAARAAFGGVSSGTQEPA